MIGVEKSIDFVILWWYLFMFVCIGYILFDGVSVYWRNYEESNRFLEKKKNVIMLVMGNIYGEWVKGIEVFSFFLRLWMCCIIFCGF